MKIKMPFSSEDKVIIEHYLLDKGYGPNRGWTVGGLRNLIKKIDQTKSIDRKKGSSCSISAQRNDNNEYVEEELLGQETNPG